MKFKITVLLLFIVILIFPAAACDKEEIEYYYELESISYTSSDRKYVIGKLPDEDGNIERDDPRFFVFRIGKYGRYEVVMQTSDHMPNWHIENDKLFLFGGQTMVIYPLDAENPVNSRISFEIVPKTMFIKYLYSQDGKYFYIQAEKRWDGSTGGTKSEMVAYRVKKDGSESIEIPPSDLPPRDRTEY